MLHFSQIGLNKETATSAGHRGTVQSYNAASKKQYAEKNTTASTWLRTGTQTVFCVYFIIIFLSFSVQPVMMMTSLG